MIDYNARLAENNMLYRVGDKVTVKSEADLVAEGCFLEFAAQYGGSEWEIAELQVEEQTYTVKSVPGGMQLPSDTVVYFCDADFSEIDRTDYNTGAGKR